MFFSWETVKKLANEHFLTMFSLPASGPYLEYGPVSLSNENGSFRIRIRNPLLTIGVCKDNLSEVQDKKPSLS
jgi:hypothetical protein